MAQAFVRQHYEVGKDECQWRKFGESLPAATPAHKATTAKRMMTWTSERDQKAQGCEGKAQATSLALGEGPARVSPLAYVQYDTRVTACS